MVRNIDIKKLIIAILTEKTKKALSLSQKNVSKQEKHREGENVLEESESEDRSVDDTAHDYPTSDGYSESDRLNLERYSQALLHSCNYAERKEIFKEIADEKNASSLKEVFFPNCFAVILKEKNNKTNNTREKYEKCIYKIFMLFTDKEFTKNVNHSKDILNWLADQKIEKIIQKRDHMKMVHWMLLSNNLYGAKWAFQRYHNYMKKDSDFEKIFKIFEEDKQDIFSYVANGIILMEKSNLNSQAEVISLVIREFERTIKGSKSEKKQKISEKVELMKSLLLEIELTQELEEQLTINNYCYEIDNRTNGYTD